MVFWTEETLGAKQSELDSGSNKYRRNLEEGWWAIPYFAHAPRMDQDPLDISNFRTAKRMLIEKLGEDNVDELWARWYVGTPHCLLQFNPDALEDREAVGIVVDILNAYDGYPVLDEDDYSECELEYQYDYIRNSRRGSELTEDQVYDAWCALTEPSGDFDHRRVEDVVDSILGYLRCDRCGYHMTEDQYDETPALFDKMDGWSHKRDEVTQYRIDMANEFFMVPLPGMGEPANLPKPVLEDEEGLPILLDLGGEGYVCPKCIIGNLLFT